MKHHNHFQYSAIERRHNKRGEAALDIVTAIGIGVGLAVLLVAWWSA
jgi:hypothetical protein